MRIRLILVTSLITTVMGCQTIKSSFGLDPTSAIDRQTDLDADGLINVEEFNAGTIHATRY